MKKLLKKILKPYKEVLKPIYELYKSRPKLKRTYYAWCYKNVKLNDNMIVYEAHFGRGLLCNPYAIFKELLQNQEFSNMLHVWIIDDMNDNEKFLKEYKNNSNVVFVKRDSRKFYKVLCQAKYVINNSTLPAFFTKRENQILINTWHGIPLKTLGYDMPNPNEGVANTIRNFLMADYLLSANEFMTKMYLDSYKLRGVYEGKIIEEGYPRNDLTIKTSSEYMINKLKNCGVKLDPNKKVIMYAPTWKGSNFAKPVINIEEFLNIIHAIESGINTEEYQFFIKPHQQVYKYLKNDPRVKDKFIPATIDANELMSVVDILISDYSSIFFDFLVTKKPILFYIPDLKEYTGYRGFYLPIEEIPGPRTDDINEIVQWINKIDDIKEEYKDIYNKNYEWACKYDDGNVTKRVVNSIFKKEESDQVLKNFNTGKKKILIYRGPLTENGITHSVLNLLNVIDYDKYDITFYVSKHKEKASKEKINSINPNVRTLVRVGTWNGTLKESIHNELVLKNGIYKEKYKKMIPWTMFEREYKRCFGDTKFDYVIDFSGYSPFFSLILLAAKGAKKIVWQHNDIKLEQAKIVKGVQVHKFTLGTMISLYPLFDEIVSCSKEVMRINHKNVATNETKDSFRYAKNVINFSKIYDCISSSNIVNINDVPYIIKNANKNENGSFKRLDLMETIENDKIKFVTVGRMSPEKNHIALIEAFAKLNKKYHNTQLYIIGDGPLRTEEIKLVANLKLEKKVIFLGSLKNPFIVMKQCDCFILPSIHEGQPLTVIEARAIELPMILTKFSTVKDSLIENGQLLVETDSDSICEGMEQFILGNVPSYHFDAEKYNEEAYQQFVSLIS